MEYVAELIQFGQGRTVGDRGRVAKANDDGSVVEPHGHARPEILGHQSAEFLEQSDPTPSSDAEETTFAQESKHFGAHFGQWSVKAIFSPAHRAVIVQHHTPESRCADVTAPCRIAQRHVAGQRTAGGNLGSDYFAIDRVGLFDRNVSAR
ncbi:hypothetical protein [Candidatus Poriferisodalis sp.]|uniref:hypothetical protein n=1 Tax=Candidatus Poriferisodalis sp. TaxID=3101277 RepID=UPI003B015E8E